MKISLCMIARDEERNLPACLDSFAGVVDEICVLDTGSSDSTVQIAREKGARVETHPWSDDFATARNAALDMASGDWILVVDADEVLEDPDARAKLEAFAQRFEEQDAAPCGRVTMRNEEGSGACDLISITRFLPRRDDLDYRGRVHEQVHCHGVPAPAEETGVVISHRGYLPEVLREQSKVDRNRQLLLRAIADSPDDGYLWYQLGQTLAVGGEPRHALDAFERALERCPDDAPWGPPCLERAGYCLRELDRSKQALALLGEVEEAFEGRSDTCFLIALLAMDTGDLERAEAGFRRCLELAPALPGPTQTNPSTRTFAPAHNLGVLFEVVGRTEEAREAYGQALAFNPEHHPSREGLARLAEATDVP